MFDDEAGFDSDQIQKKNKSGLKSHFKLKTFSKFKRSSFNFKKEDIDKEFLSSPEDNSAEEFSDCSLTKSTINRPFSLNKLFRKEFKSPESSANDSGFDQKSEGESSFKDFVPVLIDNQKQEVRTPSILIEDFDNLEGREPYSRPLNDFNRNSSDWRSLGRSFGTYGGRPSHPENIHSTPEPQRHQELDVQKISKKIQINKESDGRMPKSQGFRINSIDFHFFKRGMFKVDQYFECSSAPEKKIPFSLSPLDRWRESSSSPENDKLGKMAEDSIQGKKPGPVPMVMASIKKRPDPSAPKERLFKVLLIGDPGVGKTSFVQRYTTNLFRTDYKGTVGVDFALKILRMSEDTIVKLQLWDVAGQERFTWMTRVYYRDARGCIIMFDLSNRNSFLNAARWKTDLDKKCVLPDGSLVPCLLLANKCDLKDRKISINEIEDFYRKHEFIGWTETSAKNDLMVKDSVKFLVDVMLKQSDDDYYKYRRETGENSYESPTLRLDRISDISPSAANCNSC